MLHDVGADAVAIQGAICNARADARSVGVSDGHAVGCAEQCERDHVRFAAQVQQRIHHTACCNTLESARCAMAAAPAVIPELVKHLRTSSWAQCAAGFVRPCVRVAIGFSAV